ncbi:hypothetical protein AKJ57_00580 [candidate division MSBL1 archaeon SCGC-AAA259A05]|uniref:Helix-turn-helix type 11 domain-containing protein n=1 Tax=candidate division MSBL1 archaeon SCGC-AAA259A05 TaxID=1698259 RepID=A0A133UBR5_9EURY|nr:hypothetical protein AKJ57_00580 [candidate division MSBL1 archaeon SCGC-AAA259A05]
MKKRQILNALKNADKPLTIKELSEETDISISSLRMDLYRLQEEGEVESREEQGDLRWKIKVSTSIEEKYEKMSKNIHRD